MFDAELTGDVVLFSKRFWLFFAFVNVLILPVYSGQAQERIALVIGNSSYEFAGALPNPRNDAAAIGAALEDVGFEVTISTDLDQRQMQAAFRDFGLRAETAEVAVVYFAGHGIQVADSNYLLPTDAQLRRERDLIYEATPLSVVMAEVAQARQLGIVILDACRDNPLADNLRQSLGPVRSKMVGRGMARVEDVPADTLIAFSTRFNQVAYDGWTDTSPFTEALVRHLEEPGVELDLFFRKVRDTVLDLTADRQEPRTLDALGATPFYFRPPRSNQAPVIAKHEPMVVPLEGGAVPTFIKAPVDPDDDKLSIEIIGMPNFGTMEGPEGPVRFGEKLTVAQLTELKYRPAETRTGPAGAFVFVVRDGRGGVTAGRVPIEVVRSNKPPVVAALQTFAWPNVPLGIEKPTDPDGDALSIKVVALPERGRILDGERDIEVGDEFGVDALAGLMLAPDNGVAGDFVYEVADGQGGVAEAVFRFGSGGGTDLVVAELPTGSLSTSPGAADPDSDIERGLTEQQPASELESAVIVEMRRFGDTAGDDSAVDRDSGSETAVLAFLETTTASNIRNAPTAEGGWVTSVPGGTRLKLVEKVEGVNWFQIETTDGEEGFISGQLVRPVEAEPVPIIESQTVRIEDLLPSDGSNAEAGLPNEAESDVAALDLSSADSAAGQSEFTECPACPTMVAVPEGRFRMGSADGDAAQQPVRDVTVAKPFAIGKYEVTVRQWKACVDAGSCSRIGDLEVGDQERPMQNVSWADATAYVSWLSQETGYTYRLPSEAEWEYAARGGRSTRFWWGDSYDGNLANCSECGDDWDRKRPMPSGRYQANPFGLHDMNGGVSEWVADCWVADYRNAPSDASVRSASSCPRRVLRGGSWRSKLDDITSASRFRYDEQVRYYTNGFRVARELP